jgi:uncharacterized protein (TIGR02284 family)
MQENEKMADILNDLVKINNDRMEGYTKAISETKDTDSDLKAIFEAMKIESFQNRRELVALVEQLGEKRAEGTRLDGKIYRAWMDVKASFSGNSRKSVLENCEFGEDAAQKAYKTALDSDGDLTTDVKQTLLKQQRQLRMSHEKIKQMRDIEH